MNESNTMDPSIWPTEDEVPSSVVLENYNRLRKLGTMKLIEQGIPGIKPPEIDD